MLLKIDYSGKSESRFICDRCAVKILGKDRSIVRIYEGKRGKIIKKWDLCPSCNRKLFRGIENYKKDVE